MKYRELELHRANPEARRILRDAQLEEGVPERMAALIFCGVVAPSASVVFFGDGNNSYGDGLERVPDTTGYGGGYGGGEGYGLGYNGGRGDGTDDVNGGYGDGAGGYGDGDGDSGSDGLGGYGDGDGVSGYGNGDGDVYSDYIDGDL